MIENYKTVAALLIVLLLVLSAVALTLGQGGTGREPTNANSNKQPPTTKRTPSTRKPTGRSSTSSNDRGTTNSAGTSTKTPALPRTLTNSGIEFVLIPAGSFIMGSTNGQSDETPVHRVTISSPFYMGKYEVTQDQWLQFMGTTVGDQRMKADPASPKRRTLGQFRYPMNYVSWEEAKAFVQKLNSLNDGYTYRLPTEAEWEYACRAATTADYAGELESMGWYLNNSGKSNLDGDNIGMFDLISRIKDNSNGTHEVGTKLANGFGLYDMHGNVWEWCEDWYHSNYDGAPDDGSAWVRGGEPKNRVLRGGSWYHVARHARSAERAGSPSGNRSETYGFRVVANARTQ